jgi:hypothetical protein
VERWVVDVALAIWIVGIAKLAWVLWMLRRALQAASPK